MTAIRGSRPADVESEAIVIAMAMGSARWADEIVTAIKPEDFYAGAHRTIFRHVVELRRRGEPCDSAALGMSLRTGGDYENVGGSSALAALLDAPASTRHGALCHRLRNLARLRRMIEAMTELLGEAHDRGADVDAFVDEAETRIFAAARADSDNAAARLGDVIDAELARILAVQNGGGSSMGLPSGLPSLDAMFGGFRPGEVTVIAGRPGQGKTALAVSLAVNVAASNHDGVTQCCFIASLEMVNAAIARRTLAAVSGVNVRKYERGALHPGQADSFITGVERARNLPIWIDDRVRMTPMQLRGHIRRLQAKYDKPRGVDGRPQRLSLVVVDYLQRMGADVKRKDRFAEVADNMNAIAETAKETGVHVMLLAQLNRENVKRSGSNIRPKMSDLAESGEIEKAAHTIALLHRPETYEADKANVPDAMRGLAEVIFDKQREGETGIVRLAYDGEATLFREPDPSDVERWRTDDGPRKAYAPRGQRARFGGGV